MIIDGSFRNTAKTPLQVSNIGKPLRWCQHERGACNLFDNCHVCAVYSKLMLSLIFVISEEKTFLVQSYDDEDDEGDRLWGEFEKYTMHNNDEYVNFLERVEAMGLERRNDVSNTPMVATSLDHIIPGETYDIISRSLKSSVKDIEDRTIEDEMLLAVTNFVNEMFKLPIEIFPTRTMYKNKNPIMEWDRIIVCDNKVFLLESEHEMTKVCIKNY